VYLHEDEYNYHPCPGNDFLNLQRGGVRCWKGKKKNRRLTAANAFNHLRDIYIYIYISLIKAPNRYKIKEESLEDCHELVALSLKQRKRVN